MDGMENHSMIILLAFVSVIGSAMTLALLWPYGAFTALFGMPLGVSALVLAVSILIALQKLGQAIEPEAIEDPPNALAYEAD
jgi:divalent metal cation (Fe/Co/Zn/Cd) transporter